MLSPALPLLVGLDAGGTKTALAARRGEEEIRRTGPGTNLQRDGLAFCTDTLATLVEEVASAEDVRLVLAAGVAGAGRADDQAALADGLRSRLSGPSASPLVEVVHDGALALDAAFGEGSGLAVVAGTGSVLLARTEDGSLLRAGGWGERIGDIASGTALGRAAAAAVADDFDGGEPTVLRQRLAESYGVQTPDDLIALVYRQGLSFSDLAPMVVNAAEAQDWAATRILQQQANALAQRAAWLTARTAEAGGVASQIAFLGGLGSEPFYHEVLAGAFLRYLPGWRIVQPVSTPVEAALHRASRLLDT